MIEISEFARSELRVAEILSAEGVPGADKLYLLRVSLGAEERQLVAGLRPYYEPKELEGKKIIVVANLKPAVIKGVQSQGMLLAAQSGENVSLLTVDRDVAAGSRIS
jgi:methionine--tRNA ligase beta chain